MRLREKLAPRFVNFVSLGSVLFSVLGCASVSVESQRADTTRRLRRKPQVLIVKDFSFPRQAEVRADRSGKELLTFEQKVQLSLREQLVRALGRYGIPVTFASTSLELRRLRKRQPAWLITGQFTRVRQGSRAYASNWAWVREERKWKQLRKSMIFQREVVRCRYSPFQPPVAATPNPASSHRLVLLRQRLCRCR